MLDPDGSTVHHYHQDSPRPLVTIIMDEGKQESCSLLAGEHLFSKPYWEDVI